MRASARLRNSRSPGDFNGKEMYGFRRPIRFNFTFIQSFRFSATGIGWHLRPFRNPDKLRTSRYDQHFKPRHGIPKTRSFLERTEILSEGGRLVFADASCAPFFLRGECACVQDRMLETVSIRVPLSRYRWTRPVN